MNGVKLVLAPTRLWQDYDKYHVLEAFYQLEGLAKNIPDIKATVFH